MCFWWHSLCEKCILLSSAASSFSYKMSGPEPFPTLIQICESSSIKSWLAVWGLTITFSQYQTFSHCSGFRLKSVYNKAVVSLFFGLHNSALYFVPGQLLFTNDGRHAGHSPLSKVLRPLALSIDMTLPAHNEVLDWVSWKDCRWKISHIPEMKQLKLLENQWKLDLILLSHY